MAESTDSNVVTGGSHEEPTTGHAGLETQLPGQASTVSNLAGATGGIGAGNLVETYVDDQLAKIASDDTPLMQLMLKAKRVKVDSPVVQHYAIDEQRASVTTTTAVGDGTQNQVTLPLNNSDKRLLKPYDTVMVCGVDGYMPNGSDIDYGRNLQLFIIGKSDSGNPIAIATNGKRTNASDEATLVPTIAAGTKLVIMSNALFETQEEVMPDLMAPTPTIVYCQKRGMNSIVSDYFDHQNKRIDFRQAQIAEAQIKAFKLRGNRTLWGSRKSKFTVETELGAQTIYTTEGVRWAIKRQLNHSGKWCFEELIALAKMIYTGEDVPKSVVLLAGKNFVENIQCIDYSKHPEVQIITKANPVGWTVTTVHTVFGDIEIKHDPTLDRMGWSNSGAIIAYDRLVHYVYSQEHKSKSKVQGHEAKREATLVWDALALKGYCHIWIDGEGDGEKAEGSTTFVLWGDKTAPTNPVEGIVYVMTEDCPGIKDEAVKGTMWQATKKTTGSGQTATTTITWSEYTGLVAGV